MSRGKRLCPKQLNVLEDLFSCELDEEEVLKKWKVRQRTYQNWHLMENFAAEYKRRLKQVRRKSELIIARFAPAAAGKLVQLTQSDKEETARKACLDIINQINPKPKKKSTRKETQKEEKKLSPELTSKLLTALTENDKKASKKDRPAQEAKTAEKTLKLPVYSDEKTIAGQIPQH